MERIEGERCPACNKKILTLMQREEDIPYFGRVYVFSMECKECGFKKSDVEAKEQKEPCRITFIIKGEKDLKVRLVKSSEATISIPQLKMKVEPGPASEGYVSNIEGMLAKFKEVIKGQMESAEDDEEARKNAKNLLKKLWHVECGDMQLKIIIEDPSGNSAIISEKAVVERLKAKGSKNKTD